mmetsp:Transcript_101517/g.275907  ORF Transcript_101517/g.275907 Transcript_101517/m.275907 type:complete len:261 (+) Transcript_101517:706-1488(+)
MDDAYTDGAGAADPAAPPSMSGCRKHVMPTPGFLSKTQPRPSASFRKRTSCWPTISSVTQNVSPGISMCSVLSASMAGALRIWRGARKSGLCTHMLSPEGTVGRAEGGGLWPWPWPCPPWPWPWPSLRPARLWADSHGASPTPGTGSCATRLAGATSGPVPWAPCAPCAPGAPCDATEAWLPRPPWPAWWSSWSMRTHMVPTPGLESKTQPRPSDSFRKVMLSLWSNISFDTRKTSPGVSWQPLLGPLMAGVCRMSIGAA